MFQRRKAPAPQKRIDCLIGTGTTVQGDVLFTGGLRIDGTVLGQVKTVDAAQGTLVISEKARVEGEINVSHAVINGSVDGDVHACDYLELQPMAKVSGDVYYRVLEMHVGAVVQGKLSHVAGAETGSVIELKRAGLG